VSILYSPPEPNSITLKMEAIGSPETSEQTCTTVHSNPKEHRKKALSVFHQFVHFISSVPSSEIFTLDLHTCTIGLNSAGILCKLYLYGA